MTGGPSHPLTVRPIHSSHDDEAVRRIFRSTLALGRPLPSEPRGLAAYERLCLGWYLDAGRDDARLLVDGDRVVGYAVVCTDEEDHGRWSRRRALRLAPRALAGAVSSRFWRTRLRDALVLQRAPRPAPAHAHLNLLPEARSGLGALELCKAIDEICRAAGHDAWYGEINARRGRRSAALERVVGTVVHRTPNHTLTWAMGTSIDRLTVVRQLQSCVEASPAAEHAR